MRGTSQTLVLTGFKQIFRQNNIFRLSRIIWPAAKLAVFCRGQTSANYPALSVLIEIPSVISYLNEHFYFQIEAPVLNRMQVKEVVRKITIVDKLSTSINSAVGKRDDNPLLNASQ